MPTTMAGTKKLALLVSLLVLVSGCTSMRFKRTEEDAGTFRSRALSLTFLGFEIPGNARLLARGNAADSTLPNLIVEKDSYFPYLGPFDFLLEVLSIRYARVEGTWGFPARGEGDEDRR